MRVLYNTGNSPLPLQLATRNELNQGYRDRNNFKDFIYPMNVLSRSKGLKLRQSIPIFVLLILLSGCITVRFYDEATNSKLPEITSRPGMTDVSPTITPSPMLISTAWQHLFIFQPVLKTNTWYFIAVTRQERTITMYLDGRAVAFGDFDPLNLDAPIPLLLGRKEGSQVEYFDGRIDEVEIYNGTALTAQQIYGLYSAGSSGKCKSSSASNCIPPPVGLTSWWPADGNTKDIVSSLDGEFLRDATTGPGMVDYAFVFDGTGDYIEVPDDPLLNFGTGDFTIDLWVNFDDLSDSVLIEKWIQEEAQGHTYSQGWILTKAGKNVWFVMDDGSGQGGGLIAIEIEE
jgi:Concanavalin A-like lectin/glucanases superfamily